MTIEEALSYIHAVNWRGSKPGLSRTRELLRRLGDPQKDLKFVHVAGTNGKGSVSAGLASVLQAAGYRTGLYTSPYINCFNERMQINGEMISDDELAELVTLVRPEGEAMEDKPTEFEIVTALGMLYFQRHACEVVVLEVGLGGELDSTNVIDTPELAVITAIGLDHTRELGDTIEQIAAAKAGIIKGGDVVVYGSSCRAMGVFQSVCAEKNAALHRTDFSRLRNVHFSLEGCVFDFGAYERLRLPLAGLYQANNAALTITALEVLRSKGWNIPETAIRSGLAAVRWPGRFQLLRRDPVFIQDGAHNPHGIHAAVESLLAYFADRKIVFLLGVMADKDVKKMLSELLPLAQCFVTATPANPRAMPAAELAAELIGMGASAEAAGTIPEGVHRAMELAGREGVVCALGSLYFSADVRRAVEADPGV